MFVDIVVEVDVELDVELSVVIEVVAVAFVVISAVVWVIVVATIDLVGDKVVSSPLLFWVSRTVRKEKNCVKTKFKKTLL